jgi:hypothetical protein
VGVKKGGGVKNNDLLALDKVLANKKNEWKFTLDGFGPIDGVQEYVGTVFMVTGVSFEKNGYGTYKYDITIGRAKDFGYTNPMYKELIDTTRAHNRARRRLEKAKPQKPSKKKA